jgi:hypothetical protein
LQVVTNQLVFVTFDSAVVCQHLVSISCQLILRALNDIIVSVGYSIGRTVYLVAIGVYQSIVVSEDHILAT